MTSSIEAKHTDASRVEINPANFIVREITDQRSFELVMKLRAKGYRVWGEVNGELTDEYDHLAKSQSFAVFDGNKEVPVGTVRLIREKTPTGLEVRASIDAMWLMKVEGKWPHEKLGKEAAEMSMYTVDADYRRFGPQITKLLFEAAENSVGNNVLIYGLMQDFVRKGVERAGKVCDCVEEAHLNLEDPEVKKYCERFSSYFLKDPCPHLYIMYSPGNSPHGR